MIISPDQELQAFEVFEEPKALQQIIEQFTEYEKKNVAHEKIRLVRDNNCDYYVKPHKLCCAA